ncbi:MAG: hypothetical protein LC130_22320 [Bryobacterales bacterium]|nr:hypothetical protein [Bryobacterales bacterium]
MLSQYSIFFRSTAVFLSWLLIVPPVARMTGGGSRFEAGAQTGTVRLPDCYSDPITLYPNPVQRMLPATCDGRAGAYRGDLEQLELEAITEYLNLHGLLFSEHATIYNYGRSDLRAAPKSGVSFYARILSILSRAPQGHTGNYGNLNPYEIRLYQWFSAEARRLERMLYQKAVVDKNSFKSQRCTWKPDPEIAKVYNLVYTPSTACLPDPQGSIGGPSQGTVPSYNYFVSADYPKSGLINCGR